MADMNKAAPKMSARDVNVFYGEKQAIQNVSIDVALDDVTAFIGPSGCGKSTFLRTLNRMNDTVASARVEGTITLALSGDADRGRANMVVELVQMDLRTAGPHEVVITLGDRELASLPFEVVVGS